MTEPENQFYRKFLAELARRLAQFKAVRSIAPNAAGKDCARPAEAPQPRRAGQVEPDPAQERDEAKSPQNAGAVDKRADR